MVVVVNDYPNVDIYSIKKVRLSFIRNVNIWYKLISSTLVSTFLLRVLGT